MAARKLRAKSRAAGKRRVIFTIVSANYIAYAATLMQSVRAVHPDADRFIVLADAPRSFPDIDLAAELLPCDALDVALLGNMKVWYSVIEFNTAVKPYAFLRFLDVLDYDEAVYLDPDILVLRPLEAVFAGLAEHSVVLTPHMMQPLQDGREPSDLTIMKSGVYNLGFLAVRADADGKRLMQWWADRCLMHCRVDIAGNMFTDQRWMDLAPVLVERPCILRHPGYNVAYWNIVHRAVGRGPDGAWQADGQELVFFHFSGIDPDNPRIFSKHQNRYTGDNLGEAGEWCALYRARVLANGWAQYRGTRYGFANFPNGRPIENPMRRWVLRAIDDERLAATETLALDPDFFDAADETAAARGATLTRYMYQFWLDRSDLQAVFDVYTQAGLDAYHTWFVNGDAEGQGVDGRTVAAARALREPSEAAAAGPARNAPWPQVASEAWPGVAAEALEILRGDVTATIGNARTLVPRGAALAWELRDDLRGYFHVDDPEGLQNYIAWAFTSGMAEDVLEPELLTSAFLDQICRVSRISAHFNDVPLTEGMLITRHVEHRRDYLDAWRRFPAERAGRLAHGLWYCFIAPDLFHWPDVVTASVRAWFEELTDISCGDFRLNRAELALWEMRPDLQRTFPLTDGQSCWAYLHWVVQAGLSELQLTLDQFDPRLRRFLASDSPRYPGVPQILELIHASRLDLQAAFDLSAEEGRTGLRSWGHHHFQPTYAGTPAAAILPPPAPAPAPAIVAPQPAALLRARIGLTGLWSAPSGRGEDVRSSAAALKAAGMTDFLVIDRESGRLILPDGSEAPEGAWAEVDVNIVHTNADTAWHDWRFLSGVVTAGRSIGFWAWELDRLPHYWLHAYSFYDEIWASTRFAEGAFAREGLRPVQLVPMAVLPPAPGPRASRAALGLPEAATIFLFMFDFRSYVTRKNPEAVVEAFMRAFPAGDEPARLVIKTQGGATEPAAWWRLTALCTDPRIEIRDLKLERAELLGLLESADAFVSLHRSEGFGRGPAEAMLLGKPVIVTGYSGTEDFATPDCAYVVDYTLDPVRPGEYPGAEGQSWADADVEQAASWMRLVHEDGDAARALGLRAKAQIERLYNPRTVGEAMLRALGAPAALSPVQSRSRAVPEPALES